jgi:DNA invertase Pin-like site-specific DNA recombinase
LRTACYARYSSDLQRQTSIVDQVRGCRDYAERQGWTWQEQHCYVDEGISGKFGGRGPWRAEALLAAAMAPQRQFDVVLVDDSSRLRVNQVDALRILRALTFDEIRVVFISQGIDSHHEQAEVMVTMHGIVDAPLREGVGGKD